MSTSMRAAHTISLARRVLAVTALLLAAACSGKTQDLSSVSTQVIQRRDIVIDAQATGVVEPINVVEIKSKASGQITKMTVETGSQVQPGDLLVQIETRDTQNQYDQAAASLAAARSKLTVSTAQKLRADELFKGRIITATEHEAAQIDFANAQAQLVSGRTILDLSKQRLEDATVTAPVAGTIIERTVTLGTVITSATGAFGGGTTLLKMADLSRVRVRALFNETDIGQVRSGQTATVTVDAYPDRRFIGLVEKIEPQAVVQQNVTMFPVLVTLENGEGLLKPGMNGETSVLVEQRSNVIAVPNDAVRSPREAAATAPILGLDSDTVRVQLAAQMASRGGGRREGERAPSGFQAPQVSDADCAAVTAALQQRPAERAKLASMRQEVMSGALDRDAGRTQLQAIYAAVGIDGRVAGACARRERQPRETATSPAGAQPIGTGRPVESANTGSGGGSRRTRAGLLFVKSGVTFEPRLVQLGAANFDYTEVVSGLKEGEEVAMLAAAALQSQRQQQNDRIRQSTGVPGLQQAPASGAAATGRAGGNGARSGARP